MSAGVFPVPEPDSGSDARFTIGLLADVLDVLARHGYPVADMTSGDHAHVLQGLYRLIYTSDSEGGGGR
ncbi:hypothetical protein BAY59_29210 [Prauserella coralliicola]|nr:hypothetical protein BAY59_29210 [Prauserella coralliicola]